MSEWTADVIEECRQRLERGESVANCVAAYPSHAAALERLLPIVARAQSLAHDPDPAYATAARQRFAERLAETRASQVVPARSGIANWLQRLAIPIALVLVFLLSGFGLVQASNDTLPDSPLYTVKQARESIAQALARSPEARAVNAMRFAGQRLSEIHQAEQMRKGPAVIRPLAARMVAATNQATRQIDQTSGTNHERLVRIMRPLLTQEMRTLDRYARSPNREVAQTARALLRQLQADEQALK